MPRKVPPWKGKTPDSKVPPRVRLRVFERFDGRCHRCGRRVNAGEKWTLEHLVAIVNGGPNEEPNLTVTCGWCLPQKNAADVAEKARIAAKRQKHMGIVDGPKMQGRPFDATRKSFERKAKAKDKLPLPPRPEFIRGTGA